MKNDILLKNFPKPTFYWTADKTGTSNNGTHQEIARKALQKINSIMDGFYINENIVISSDDPDINETDEMNGRHFFNPTNQKNYWKNAFSNQNAQILFIKHYEDALQFFKLGNRENWEKSLGNAIHYLSDICTPVHTGDQISSNVLSLIINNGSLNFWDLSYPEALGLIIPHVAYENYVNERDTSFLNNHAVDYLKYNSNDLINFSNNLASESYKFYSLARGNDEQKNIAMNTTLPMAVDATASILYKFFQDVHKNKTTHEFRYESFALTHTGICVYCDYYFVKNHSIWRGKELGHSIMCVCGLNKINAPHSWKRQGIGNICIFCGFYTTKPVSSIDSL